MRRRLLFFAPLALMAFAVLVLIGGYLVMSLWNWLLPPLFGWHTLGFWQALALLALCRILFGGFGIHGPGRSAMRRRMEERWSHASPEERERIRERMRERFGFGGPPPDSERI